MHALCHYSRNLRKFGSGLNFCTCHWELYHRDGVVKPFKLVRARVHWLLLAGVSLWRPYLALPQDARREAGMLGRLLAKNTRNVLLTSFLAARDIGVVEDEKHDDAVLSRRKRYARSRHVPIPICTTSAAAKYTFSSLRRGNFDKVLSEHRRQGTTKHNKPPGGITGWRSELKKNMIRQVKDQASRIGIDAQEVYRLKLEDFRVADVLDVKRAEGSLRFVASDCYRRRRPRYDVCARPHLAPDALLHESCAASKASSSILRLFNIHARC